MSEFFRGLSPIGHVALDTVRGVYRWLAAQQHPLRHPRLFDGTASIRLGTIADINTLEHLPPLLCGILDL